MRDDGFVHGRDDLLDLVDYRAEHPVGIVGISVPMVAVGVDEQTRPWNAQELVNLAADVAEIDMGHGRVGHIDGTIAPEVDMYIGMARKRREQSNSFGSAA